MLFDKRGGANLKTLIRVDDFLRGNEFSRRMVVFWKFCLKVYFLQKNKLYFRFSRCDPLKKRISKAVGVRGLFYIFSRAFCLKPLGSDRLFCPVMSSDGTGRDFSQRCFAQTYFWEFLSATKMIEAWIFNHCASAFQGLMESWSFCDFVGASSGTGWSLLGVSGGEHLQGERVLLEGGGSHEPTPPTIWTSQVEGGLFYKWRNF